MLADAYLIVVGSSVSSSLSQDRVVRTINNDYVLLCLIKNENLPNSPNLVILDIRYNQTDYFRDDGDYVRFCMLLHSVHFSPSHASNVNWIQTRQSAYT